MLSSPILSNAPLPGEKPRSQPISCFVSHISDKIKPIINHLTSVCWYTIVGGGIGADWGEVRTANNGASGPVSFLTPINSIMTSFTQGKTRKGSYAAYSDVSHPEIIEFISMRIPTGGDINRKNFNLFNAVNITDEFMLAIKNNTPFHLADPKTKKKTPVSARTIWQTILECRHKTVTPYLNFIDTINAELPQSMKDLGLRFYGSNLCDEIHLPTDDDTDAICCVSSLNAEYYRDWTEQFVRDIVCLLDNVLDSFIDCDLPELSKAVKGAIRDKPLGIGVMGLGTLFQKERIPFEFEHAKRLNEEIFNTLKQYAEKETLLLGKERGECYSMRNT